MGFLDSLKFLVGSKPAASTQLPQAQPNPTARRVLVVEDEPMLSKALEMKLTHEGFTVALAANGLIGLNTAQTFAPHVILTDLLMPVMDGKTMLSKLRALPQFKNTPVIVLTNAGTIENMEETHMYGGASDFLIKSNIDLDQVVSKINEMMPAGLL